VPHDLKLGFKIIKKRISGIRWRFLFIDSCFYSLFTPAIYGIAWLLNFFGVPLGESDIVLIIIFWLFNIAFLVVVNILIIIYTGIENQKSTAIMLLIKWKLKMGWAKFCVLQTAILSQWPDYQIIQLQEPKKKYYDDPQDAAHRIWLEGFSQSTGDLNQIFALLIKGRKYNLPKTRPITVQEIQDHINHCLDQDEAFYGKATSATSDRD